MSTTVVLDASAAVRAVMDPAGQPALLDRLAAAALVLAPSLMRAEAANALWKYCRADVIDADEALLRHHEAMLLVHRFVDDQGLFPEALHWAMQVGHPVYDALYVLLTRRNAATLLTFDKRLHLACADARISSEWFSA